MAAKKKPEDAAQAAPEDEKVEVEPSEGPAPTVDSDDPPGYKTVTLSQHWTNPDTGENVLPGGAVRVTVDQARGLEGAGYLANAAAQAEAAAEQPAKGPAKAPAKGKGEQESPDKAAEDTGTK